MLTSVVRCALNRRPFFCPRVMFTAAGQPDLSNDLVVKSTNSAGVITINRPRVMNAFNTEMMQQLRRIFEEFQKDKKIVIIKGNGKVFSCGGDLKSFLHNIRPGQDHLDAALAYKGPEYNLLNMIYSYKIPYVALIDGLTMGAGLGVTVHARYKVATERTVLAMPENKVGYFADVGASYFLPRLPRNIGIYMGVTGEPLIGDRVLKAGLATHYMQSSKIPELESDIVNCTSDEEVKRVLDEHAERVDTATPLDENIDRIEHCFGADTVEEIVQRLQAINNNWSKKVLKRMGTLSPGSMKVSLRAMRRGAGLQYACCLRMEYGVIVRFVGGFNADFLEGVRAVLIDKDNAPRWSPATLEEADDFYVESYFQDPPPQRQLQLGS